MRTNSQILLWIFTGTSCLIFGLVMYLIDLGLLHESAGNWQYYADICSLRCARDGCTHLTRFPGLYAGLVQPQVDLLKSTGQYQLANLVVYFGLLPGFYGFWAAPRIRRYTGSLPAWFTWLGAGIGVFLLLAVLDSVRLPGGQANLYWGGTQWCVGLANQWGVSLLDVYTLLFGILIPGSVLVLLAYTLCQWFFNRVNPSVQ